MRSFGYCHTISTRNYKCEADTHVVLQLYLGGARAVMVLMKSKVARVYMLLVVDAFRRM